MAPLENNYPRGSRMGRKWSRRSRPALAGRSSPGAGPKQAAHAVRTRAREEPERRRSDLALIYGFHSVEAALKSLRRELIRLYATAPAAERLQGEIEARGVDTRILTIEDISIRAPREAVHQGVLLEARPLPPFNLADLPPTGLALVLDQVTDPHNVGAIVRTAAAFAADALVTTERHSPELSGALAKSASGGLEHVPIAFVPNLARALKEIGDMGYLRIGLDSHGVVSLSEIDVSRPLALVLGAEDKGLRRLTRENCDVVARLDMPGPVKSLNVSNACAMALALIHMKLRRAD